VNNDKVPEWAKATPYEIRDQAMMDYQKAVDALKAKNEKNYKFKFRIKKDKQQSIAILSKCFNAKRGIVGILMKDMDAIYNKQIQKLPDHINYDSRIIRTRLGEYYLSIPMPLQVKSDNQAPTLQGYSDGVISLDPGVRTFMTGFEANGNSCEWGKNDISRIHRLCYHYDQLMSRIAKSNGHHLKRNRFRMKRASRRMQVRIRNLVDCVHQRLIKWLCENYRVILLPKFETSKMTRRSTRKINGKTARSMLTWSHYRFRQRLISTAREYPWVNLILVDEDYTSKTCGGCGFLHTKLGGQKTFRCPSCAMTMDRDLNGARNIMLKFLGLIRPQDSLW